MANLTIRNLPDDVHERLKEQAQRNRRSLNQEVIAKLIAVGQASDESRSAVIERIKEMRSRMKGFMTAEEIAEAKDEGRK